jgi:hypothetical protein
MVLAMSRPSKHPKTGVYRFRKAVPDSLRALVGFREVIRSLGTKDPRQAAAKYPAVAAQVAAEWAALLQGPQSLTHKEASALVGRWYRWFVPIFEDDPGDDPEAWGMWADELRDLARWGFGGPDDDEDAPRPRGVEKRIVAFLHDRARVDAFFEAEAVRLSDEGMGAFIAALEGEFFAAMRLLAHRTRRDYSPDTRPQRFPKWVKSEAPAKASSKAASSLTGLVEDWWREAQAAGRKPSTYESYSNSMASLVSFLGHEDALRVTPEDILRFKDHRLATVNPRQAGRSPPRR